MAQTVRRWENFDDIFSENTDERQLSVEEEPLLSSHQSENEVPDTVDAVAARDGSESCVFCRDIEQVRRKGQISVGDHIELPRPQFFAKLFGFWIYSHFAMVVKMEDVPKEGAEAENGGEVPIEETKVKLTLIESMPTKPTIRERTIILDLKKDYLLIHRYRQPTFGPDETVRRAYDLLHQYQRWEEEGGDSSKRDANTRWNLITKNCEDAVVFMKTGVSISSQVRDKADTGASILSTVASKILNVVKEISRYFSDVLDDMGNVGKAVGSVASKSMTTARILAYVFIPISAIIAICVAAHGLYKYHGLRKRGKICSCCYSWKKSKVWTTLAVALALIGVGLLASEFGGPIIAIVLAVIGIGATILLAKLFNKLYRFVVACFPSRNVNKTKLDDPTTLEPADCVTFYYYTLPHEGVVTKVTETQIYVMHYAWTSWFERSIIEEPFAIDKTFRKHDYPVPVYPTGEVIARARSREGEKRFNTCTNRSSHFVNWCKVKENENGQSVSRTEWREVFSWNEVGKGSAIMLWMYARKHCAILSEINQGSKTIIIFHYGHKNGVFSRRVVKEETIEMDLKINTLWMRSLTQYDCHDPDEIIARARNSKDRTDFSNSFNFCLHCAVK